MEKMREKERIENELKVFEKVAEKRKTYVDEFMDGDIFEEPDVFE